LHQTQLAKDVGLDIGTISRVEAAGSETAKGLSKNLEKIVLALERRGVEITEDGVRRVVVKT